jgi:hypothetical protein
MELLVDILKRNENAKVIICFPTANGGREAMSALASDVFYVEGSATYGEPGEDAYGGIMKSANRFMNEIGALAGASGNGMINRQFKTIQSTIATWANSDKFVFSLQLRFYATERTIDVRQNVRKFLECTYPLFESDVPGMVHAPNNYDFTPNTCISVQIGKWFKTQPLFLIKNTRWAFSKETITGGNPLYAEGSVQFMSYRMLSAKEVSNFLVSSVTGSEDTGKTAIT